MSSKVFFCDMCIILVIGVTFSLSQEMGDPPVQTMEGNCTCGGFGSPTIETPALPLISQSPGLVTKCDEEGEITCRNLCIALAQAFKAKGPDTVCSRLKEANELKISVFYKVCDEPWLYGNMTSEPVCCTEGKVKQCASYVALATNSTA